jgi:tRNA modification GTPase
MQFSQPTIFALASGRPPAAIAIVRISGQDAGRVLELMAQRQPVPRVATLATLLDLAGNPIDQAVVLWFPAPHSATGEDVVELHLHGGRAVVAAVLDTLGRIEGLRPAEPGEFTRRAFENGKLDLTAAEGLDDLIHADTDQQRRQALRQLQGFLGAKAEHWRRQLIEAAALVEAVIDFSDEDDVPDDLLQPALAEIEGLRAAIRAVLAAPGHSERLRDGLVIAIAGPPNAGKSTLLNRLARREAAIVSPHAGTTRDVIEVYLDLGGYPVTLLDTAGIRHAQDPVEQEGIRRAQARAEGADLVLWVTDETSVGLPPGRTRTPTWLVRNKSDTRGEPTSFPEGIRTFEISASRGDGVPDLVAALVEFASDTFGGGDAALISRARHRTLLEQCAAALDRAVAAQDAGVELVAEEIRSAIHALGRLTGRVDVEDILDVIFREFCIGK